MTLIMVVDDNQDVAEAVSQTLREAGYDAIIALTLQTARSAFDRQKIDGVIADVWMDKENGLDLVSELTRCKPPIPFVIMSGGGPGQSLEAMTARADSLGAISVLFKPFDDNELFSAVKAMLDDK